MIVHHAQSTGEKEEQDISPRTKWDILSNDLQAKREERIVFFIVTCLTYEMNNSQGHFGEEHTR